MAFFLQKLRSAIDSQRPFCITGKARSRIAYESMRFNFGNFREPVLAKNKNLLDSKLVTTSVEKASHFPRDLRQAIVFI